MATDLKPSDLDYGIIIAFVAPGFVAFHAASYQLPTAKAWMAAASDKEQSVGVFLFVLLASLCGGLIVSGVRALVIDNLLKSSVVLRKLAVPP
jgi:type II secretory pathway component PulF